MRRKKIEIQRAFYVRFGRMHWYFLNFFFKLREIYICINDESSERCNPSLTQTQNIWLMHHSCDDLYFRLFVVFLWSITLNERNERIKTHSAVILCIGSVCARLMCNVKLWLVFHSIHWLWLLSWSECFSCFFFSFHSFILHSLGMFHLRAHNHNLK